MSLCRRIRRFINSPLALLTQQCSAGGRRQPAVRPTMRSPPQRTQTAGPVRPTRSSDKWNFKWAAGVINATALSRKPLRFHPWPSSRRASAMIDISSEEFRAAEHRPESAPISLHTEHWAVGLDVGGDARKPRRASDDPVLRGWGDIPGTARGGMFASYNIDWLSVRGSVSVGGHNEGVLASLGVEAKYHPMQRLTLPSDPK